MITEHLRAYTILYFRQEKGFRDHGVTRTGLRVYAGPGRRPAVPPGGAQAAASTVIIVSQAALPAEGLFYPTSTRTHHQG
jgi:hypothetical protein